jgi:hypothetical protein
MTEALINEQMNRADARAQANRDDLAAREQARAQEHAEFMSVFKMMVKMPGTTQ